MNIHLPHPVRNQKANTPCFMPEREQFDPERKVSLKDYGRVKLRPIRPDDEKRMIHFHESLSEETIFLRYFEHISLDTRTLHERLTRVCTNTPESYAIVAERHQDSHHPAEIMAVGRLTITEKPALAAFALLMSDQAMATELPKHLLTRLIEIARVQGFKSLQGDLLTGDHDTLTLCRELGFTPKTNMEDGIIQVSLAL